MKNDSKNIIKNQDGEFIALKERKLFEKIGYSLRQYIVALLCNLSTTDLSNSTDNYQDSMRKITDYILDDYIKEEPLKAEDLEFVKNHFKKRAGVHGLFLPGVPLFFFFIMYPLVLIIYQVPSTSSVAFLMPYLDESFFYASIFIICSASYLFWRFYGVNWFLKGFEKDVVRYTLQKSLKATDKNKVKSVDGIALQYYNEEGLDIHELAKQVAKENEKGSK
jgi:hypothetical protein